MRSPQLVATLLLVGSLGVVLAQEAGQPRVEIEVSPREATVGQQLDTTLTVTLPTGVGLQAAALGPQLGPFNVVSGGWAGPIELETGRRWVWKGRLTAFRTGELELPAVTLRLDDDAGGRTVSTEPVGVIIQSVLAAEEVEQGTGELADLKPPASLDPDFRALWTALAVLGLLLAAALLVWWLQRRYASRLAAANVPADPFHRTPPHVWVYGELQKLLERRLPEQGEIEHFYRELARILKRYLTGRYRVELMEQTTEEVPGTLEQSGAPRPAIEDTVRMLRGCDRVKFARELPGAKDWKAAVEEVYRIVDRTKPVAAAGSAAVRGAA